MYVMNDARVDNLEQLVHAGRHQEAADTLRRPGYVDQDMQLRVSWYRLLIGAPRDGLELTLDALREQGFFAPTMSNDAGRHFFEELRDHTLATTDSEPFRALVQWIAEGAARDDIEAPERFTKVALLKAEDLAQDAYLHSPELSKKTQEEGRPPWQSHFWKP